MSRWLTAGVAVALITVLTAAALWSASPPAARAQTAPDVRLRETPAPRPPTPPGAESAATRMTLRLSNATLEADRETLPDGADLTLLAQPTYVALPSAGPNLLRVSPPITITARDAGGRDIDLSPAARLTFTSQDAESASVYWLDGGAWRPVAAVTLGQALVVHPADPGTYAVFARLPPDWPLRHDMLTAVALNGARLVVDDLATPP